MNTEKKIKMKIEEFEKGFYEVACGDVDKSIVAWFNPDTGHWLNEETNKQIGCGDYIDSKKIKITRYLGKTI
jgi:hypothetical protein